ncbi:alpha/beta hydrolase [Polaromonas sp. YR568]|uniref:alpha/beta hydrolase n=1 Tax=Polaromonas sp. YR568 TaxID=1855301 RepID=UPI000B839685|nr:alpha/beta fold hydrolase [Polaromonas sp. YR568]
MKRWHLFTSFGMALALLAGCATLDEKQRAWIFQPSDRTWSGGAAAAVGMDDVWVDFTPAGKDQPVRLHGLWLASDKPNPEKAPVLLYLHGARYNVTGSAPRMRRMQELGFSVLAIDYRGFGKSTHELPSEKSAYEDARAAWDWLAKKYPDRPRYIFGHSLGGPIAINLATEVSDERGTIVESTFTSIADVVSSSPQWGWMPVSLLITQRFEAVRKVDKIGSPLLVVHGDEDRLILPDLGRKLYAAAAEPKRFMLVEGGSHHNANLIGQPQYRQALAELFGMQ